MDKQEKNENQEVHLKDDTKLKNLIKKLPNEYKARFIALKKYEEERNEVEREFQKEIDLLEKKYEKLYEPLYIKRQEITSGQRDPLPEEISDSKEYEGVETSKSDEITGKIDTSILQNVKCIPHFWLTAILNSKLSRDVREVDKPVLHSLIDIRSELLGNRSFKLKFIF